MTRHGWTSVGAMLLASVLAGCGGASPSETSSPGASPSGPSPSTAARANSYLEFRDAYCATWSSMFRAVGNPDTGTGSDLSLALDAAIKARDRAAIERLAGEIQAELEVGRGHARFGGGWPPAAALMAEMDRLPAAFEAAIEAQRAAAVADPGGSAAPRQDAFEQAGGVEAWRAIMGGAGRPVQSARPPGPDYQCPGVPVSL